MKNQIQLQHLKPGIKVLMANMPADGHFNPLTGIAMHLKSIGCDVRWYTSDTYAPKIQKLGIQHYPLIKAMDISAGEIDELFPDRKNHKGQVSKLVFDMIQVFIQRSPEYYHDIVDIHQDFAFDVMVCDVTFGAIPFVKEKMNIPVVSVGIFPIVETSKDLAPAGLAMTPLTSFWGRRKQDILRLIADHVLFAKPTKVMRKMLAEYGIDGSGSNVFDLLVRKSTLMLQSGTPGFEYKRSDLGQNIRFVGPLLPYTTSKIATPWFDERLNQYAKVIVVTQGTVEKDVNKILVPTLEAFKDSDYLVIATTGGSQTESLKERFAYDNIIVEDFIPFGDILPYADVYVTNGGYGGVLLGIQNNVPLVVAGVHEGKNEINARIGYFGLGINLKTETPAVQQLQHSIETVLHEESYKQRVSELANEFLEYDTYALCEHYITEVLSQTAQKIIKKQEAVLIAG
ncbi:MAG: glycosyl transferase [Flaviaesturariibacter sp.]|nr:glycosyl transferase [Flaviaesturariibacter sp.]